MILRISLIRAVVHVERVDTMYKSINNVVNIARDIMIRNVKSGNIAIDATVGNGNDTILLASLVGQEGKVYGFDIQESAILKTKIKLFENNLAERVYLIRDSHENIDKYVTERADLIVFNLGYLPGGNHEKVTKVESTAKAVKKSLELLKENGLLLITTYLGHSEGKVEDNYIKEYLSSQSQKEVNVLKFEFINQINNPPILYCVEKNKL